MSLIIWLAKLQWGYTVDRLTYEKGWSIDRVANLVIGLSNMALVLLSIFHHSNWLIPAVAFNMSVLVSSMTGKGILHGALSRLGFQEREKILQQLKIEIRAKEQIKKKMTESQSQISTSNQARVFVFDSLESQTASQLVEESENHLNNLTF